jgi:hypothetical protein
MAALDFPNSPTLNQVYQNYIWDGEKWLLVAPAAAGGLTLISDTPPSIATTPIGSTWWESDTGKLFILVNDGNSTQWVLIGAVGPTGPPSTVIIAGGLF